MNPTSARAPKEDFGQMESILSNIVEEENKVKDGLERRGFLQGAGLIAGASAATSLAGTSAFAETPASGAKPMSCGPTPPPPSQKVRNNYSPLLEFRLAYLRAIARAWADPKGFGKDLIDEGDEKKDIQELLIQCCDLRSRWPFLAIIVKNDKDINKQTQWLPEQTAGWIGTGDKFVITLPTNPKITNPECKDAEVAEALAAYYQLFPALMGPAVRYVPTSELLTNEAPKSKDQVSALGYLSEDLGIPGGEKGSLLAFGGVVLRALALAWNDNDFLTDLTDSKRGDAAPILSKWLGYNNPFNFSLVFQTDQKNQEGWRMFTWNRPNWNFPPNDGCTPGRPNRIVLNFPNPPKDPITGEDSQFLPIALTSYNNTGPAYPFTCA